MRGASGARVVSPLSGPYASPSGGRGAGPTGAPPRRTGRGIRVYVCSCRAVTESQVDRLIREGARDVRALIRGLGLDARENCGICLRDPEWLFARLRAQGGGEAAAGARQKGAESATLKAQGAAR